MSADLHGDEQQERERILQVLERVRALRKYAPARELEVAADAAGVSVETVRRAARHLEGDAP